MDNGHSFMLLVAYLINLPSQMLELMFSVLPVDRGVVLLQDRKR